MQGAESERRGLNLPWRCPAGGLPSLSPADLAFSFFFCPYPPSPRSQSALPRRGRGSPRLFHARGFAPCIPGAESGRRGLNLRWRYPAGGLPEWTPAGADVPISGVIPDFPIPAEAAKPILQHPKSQPPCMLQDKSGTGHERRFQSGIYRESSWGLGGFFQEAPNVSPFPRFPVSPFPFSISFPCRCAEGCPRRSVRSGWRCRGRRIYRRVWRV